MASNENWLNAVLEALGIALPVQAAKVRRLLPLGNALYEEAASCFYRAWFTRKGAWTLDRAMAAYAALLKEMVELQALYARTGRYPHTAFAEVQTSVYAQPDRMRLHLEALALAQFLWIDQWERFAFYSRWIGQQASRQHLEIGPGHGLYLAKAVRRLGPAGCAFTAVDVSPASLATARAMAGPDVSFVAADFLEWQPPTRFDSLTMGEVLEHVEDPPAFLAKARECLQTGAQAFVSAPLHAPMPDHIFPFADVPALRQLLYSAGFRIRDEHACAVDALPLDLAHRFRKPIMYAAILEPA